MRQPLSLKMTVDLGGGKQDIISITEKDDPAVLAREFTHKHHLSRPQSAKLRELITHNLSASHRYLSSRSALAHSQSFDMRSRPVPQPVSPRNDRLCQKKRTNSGDIVSACSFTPKINKAQQRRRGKTEDLLMEQGVKRDERVRSQRNRVMQEELQKCTFRPALNQRSAKLAMKQRTHSPRHEALFQMAAENTKRRTANSQLNPFEYTFHPATYSARKQSESTEELLDRLTYSKVNFNAKIEKARKELESTKDSQTGQDLFVPVTGRGPQLRRDPRPASERLYSLRNLKKTASFRHTQSRPSLQSTSEEMVRQYRSRQVGKLFRLLDSDRDGLINSETVDVSGLSDRTFMLLEPLWSFLRDSASDMAMSDFNRHITSLLLAMSIEEKDFLLRSVDREEMVEGSGGSSVPPTQPQLSPLSLVIAANRYSDTDPYTRQVEERKNTQLKLDRMKKESEAVELAQCSFRPATTKYVRR